jgi:hypothetical protein
LVKAADVIWDLEYHFCLAQFKVYEQAINGDHNAQDKLTSTPGYGAVVMVTFPKERVVRYVY